MDVIVRCLVVHFVPRLKFLLRLISLLLYVGLRHKIGELCILPLRLPYVFAPRGAP